MFNNIKFGSRIIIRGKISELHTYVKTLIVVFWDIGSIYVCHTLLPILSSYWLALVQTYGKKTVHWSSRQAHIQSGQVTAPLFEIVFYKKELTISLIFSLSGLENLELIRENKN
jgi:hypothetical protein